MKEYTDKINITIGHQNRIDIEEMAKLKFRSRSKMIDIAVSEYLEKHYPNRKINRILNRRNEK